MKISLNEIRKLVKIPEGMSETELVRLIGSRLVEVEGVEDWSEKYKGIYIAKVVKCEKIPGTHLSLCQIDAGEAGREWVSGNVGVDGETDTEAEQVGLVQVVCGAPNVREGMLVAWIAPGAVVPETWGGENFELSVRKLRGYKSHGMLAALDELDLGDDHEGILEIRPGSAEVGESFAEKFGLNDLILDIENKSLTHRPDCFGIIGFAREVAGILGVKFEEDGVAEALTVISGISRRPRSSGSGRTPATAGWPDRDPEDTVKASAIPRLEIQISNPEICGRYTCAVVEMEGATEKSKYLSETDVFLAKAGMRGISRIVDVTNVLMLLTGQPLHAFDFDKFVLGSESSFSATVQGGRKNRTTDSGDRSRPLGQGYVARVDSSDLSCLINVRTAKEGEELELLDGKVIECDTNDIVIAAGETPVALAGAMGGKSTEIDDGTRRVLIESASFSLYHLRKTQMKHGIFSEAITRFTKGVPVGMAGRVLKMAVDELDGEVLAVADSQEKVPKKKVVKITTSKVNQVLGTYYSTELMKTTLENVGFNVKLTAEKMEVTVPYWRTDIHIPEDVIEEVGRLLGFDNIPQSLPMRPFSGAERNALFELKSGLREVMSQRLGANEVLTYSFVSKKLQEKVGEDVKQSYEIVNSISPELQVFRQSIVPSLLEKVYENVKAGYKDFALYEFNQVTNKGLGLDADGVPEMENHLAMACTGDFYQAKDLLLQALAEMGVEAKVEEFACSEKNVEAEKGKRKKCERAKAYYESVRSARVMIEVMNEEKAQDATGKKQKVGHESGQWKEIGVVGEIRANVKRALKLSEVSGFEIDLQGLLATKGSGRKFKPISKFPIVERDITVKVKAETRYVTLYNIIAEVLQKQKELTYSVSPMSIYQAKGESKTKNVTFKLKFASLVKTLTAEEIQAMMKQITKALKKMGAEII